jgi:hypothetical protein
MAQTTINDSGLKKLISTLFVNLYAKSFLARFTSIDNNFNDCYSNNSTNATNIKSFGVPFGSL